MGSLGSIMRPVALLLCYFLLYPVGAISHGTQTKASVYRESQPPSSDFMFCQLLFPKSLAGFNLLAPLSRFLVGLALRNALEKAGCQAYVWAVERQLYRLGGVKATQLLIHHLEGLQKRRSIHGEVSVEALIAALQLLAREQPGPDRARRSLDNEECVQEQEQSVHSVLRWLPAVGTYYNLGTALYYAAQNCLEKAKERGQDGAIDMGYDLLFTMSGLSGGPAGVLLSFALKPAVKAGVEKMIQYYYEKETNTPLSETTREFDGHHRYEQPGGKTTTMASEVSEVVSSVPYWEVGPTIS